MKSTVVLLAVFLSLPNDLVRSQHPSLPQIANDFVVLAYPAPPPEQANVERYREIADAGFDAIGPGMGAWDRGSHRRVLDLAKQVGLRVLVTDLRILPLYEEDRKPIDQSQIEAVTADYRDHPALLGYFICDEPNANYFAELASTSRRLHKADPKHFAYINLFPGYASSKQLGCENFREYIHRFIQTVKPRVLMYDHYSLREPQHSETSWYDDLEVIRAESRQAKIPFWIWLQSEGIENYLKIPTRAEVFWQACTALAYGARGISWFTYWTPPPSQGIPVNNAGENFLAEQHVGGLISRAGHRTPMYDAVREANLFLRKAGNELTGWDNQDTSRYQNQALQKSSHSPFLTLVGDDTKLVVGTFVLGDRQRLVIANDSYAKEATFRIKSQEDCRSAAVIATLEAQQKSSGNDHSHWELGPGGCLVLECKSSATRDR